MGHFKGCAACLKPRKKNDSSDKKTNSRKIDGESDTYSGESLGCVLEETCEKVRAVGSLQSKSATLKFTALDHGIKSLSLECDFIIDSGVHKTLLSEKDWKKVQSSPDSRKPKLKRSNVRFKPFGTQHNLEVLGRTKCDLIAKAGANVSTIVYVVQGTKE